MRGAAAVAFEARLPQAGQRSGNRRSAPLPRISFVLLLSLTCDLTVCQTLPEL